MDMGGSFFNSGPFMPHGGCYLWTTSLILLHTISDGAIFLSYYSIPFILLYFVRQRRDLKFKWVFVLFAAFVLACGTTHLMEIWNVWHANYWLSGFAKAITALVSVATTILLVKLMPQALALPSAEDLRKARDELEIRVQERTAELVAMTNTLQAEIAERKRVAEDLRRLAAIVECSDDAIISKDLDGLITSWNTGAEKIFGYAAVEIVGHSVNELIPPEHQDDEEEILSRVRRGESAQHYETVRVKKDGGLIDVSITVSPVKDASGMIVGSSKVARDITERKRAAAALTASEVRYRRLFEAARDGILILDAQTGMVVEVNPFLIEMLGYSREVFLGRKIWELGFFKDLVANLANFEEMQLKEYLRYENLPLEASDGRRIEVEFVSNVYLVNHQKVIQCNIRDITERKRAEEKIKATMADLERSNKELEHFAYVASHDLQEPLRMVASYTQLLAQQYASQLDDKAGKYIHYAVDGAVRMQALINDLLTYSRVGRRGKPFELADAHAILGEAIRNLAVTIEENHAVVTNADLPTVWADASQLVLVFQNLLANAIKFRRPELPHVHVSAREDGGKWLFAVQDNGIGIEARYAERVFIIFQRLHTKEEYPGTGIGLAVCQRIVERHGGRIWFESVPGKGTTFFFTIPIPKAQPATIT